MLNSVVLEVVIGLVFIYLLYSLLATIIQEMIASSFGFRAKILQRAILRMLEDEEKFSSRVKGVLYLFKRTGNGGEPNDVSYAFYNHPLIKFLGENKRHSKPAYINKETFSKVLIDLLRGDKVKPTDDIGLLIQKALDEKTISWGVAKISDETLSYLQSIWADSQGDVEKFKGYLENWFDATMERASGWYKRHTQFILFFVGLCIAIIFNVNSIEIANKLEKDPKLREQLVLQADAFVVAHPDLDKELLQQKKSNEKFIAQNTKMDFLIYDTLRKKRTEDSINLAKYQALVARRDTLFHQANLLVNNDIKKTNDLLGTGLGAFDFRNSNASDLFKTFLGWIITALAISLGAPFWFDLLNKLMKMRNSVATTSATAENKKKQD